MPALDTLLTIASEPFAKTFQSTHRLRDYSDFSSFLTRKNGFIAFESSLLVLPSQTINAMPGIEEWNESAGWKEFYSFSEEIMFFAIDLFANQFGLTKNGVVRLEAESGEIALHSTSLETWAQRILDHYDYETGWSLAREWQEKHGVLRPHYRLLGKKPFSIGGEYDVENLAAIEIREAAKKLGNLSSQLNKASEGDRVTIHGWI